MATKGSPLCAAAVTAYAAGGGAAAGV